MSEYVQDWIKKAEADIKSANKLISDIDVLEMTEIICFHAQQGAEKYLKAFLISNRNRT